MRLVIAILAMTAFLVSTMLIVPTSFTSGTHDRTVMVNPLGTVGDLSWTNESPFISPGPRSEAALVYDPPTDKFVLFGGLTDDGDNLNDTWSYDYQTNSWQNKSPVKHPDYVLGPAYAYDSVDEVMLLFPCVDAAFTVTNQTWSYDASMNEWKDLAATNSPSFRFYCSGAYDSESDKFVVFGGGDLSDNLYNETWSYDLTSNTWAMMPPAYSPAPALISSVVYDSESDRIILFGGLLDSMGNLGLLNETWSYDLNTNSWTKMTPNAGPSERFGISAVYDPISDLVITFGGVGFSYGGAEPVPVIFDDVWTYDLNTDTWSEVNQLTKPTERALGAMAIDPLNRIIVLHGGAHEEEKVTLDDTWAVQVGTTIPEFGMFPAVAIVMVVAFFVANGVRRSKAR